MSVPHGRNDETDTGSVSSQINDVTIDGGLINSGEIGEDEIIAAFTDALKQRVGADRFRMWFTSGVSFVVDSAGGNGPMTRSTIVVRVQAPFAAERLEAHFMRELRGAAMQAIGQASEVRIAVVQRQEKRPTAETKSDVDSGSRAERANTSAQRSVRGRNATAADGRPRRSNRRGGQSSSLASLLGGSPPATAGQTRRGRSEETTAAQDVVASNAQPKRKLQASNQTRNNDSGDHDDNTKAAGLNPKQASESPSAASSSGANPAGAFQTPEMASHSGMTMSSYVAGPSNQLAYTAATMVCQTPGVASPLFIFGPSGTGKTHLLRAIAEQMRRRHRMRRVIYLSSEQFTNDFISSVGTSGLPAFRRRYRDVDALLVDDVQFLGAKKATIREMLYTIETLTAAGKSLIFAGNQSPTEISGLTSELAGRMSAGLVCPVQQLDQATRETLLRDAAEQKCLLPWTEEMVTQVSSMLPGDGRVISGVVNLVGTLQRMYRRMPTLDEIKQFGGDLIRSQSAVVSLSTIERAVCETFGLDDNTLRTAVQTRTVTEPRSLAMYLSRELTSAAFSEIAKHYGGKSHSTAIAATQKVEKWLQSGKSLGRGTRAMSARQAIDRIESILRVG